MRSTPARSSEVIKMPKSNKVAGRVAVVTGGAMGIGESIAERLAEDGFMVIVADINADAARETASRISTRGWRAEAIAMNVADATSIATAFEDIAARFDRCDVLVNNAGVAKIYPFLDFPLENWQLTMNVNVTGTMICSQLAARLMKKRDWGRIVNISSVSGIRASVGRTAYGTSKAAVMGLTRQMAVELAPYGITANGVAPGPVDTPLTRTLHSESIRAQYVRSVPMSRYGQPYEMASAVSYLVTDDASYITGHIIPVDGGYVASGLMDSESSS